MKKPITRQMHGWVTDYPYVALVSTAPETVGFTGVQPAVVLCRVLSGSILVSSLLTRAEWGVFRAMPYKAHLLFDVLGGVLTLGSPWLFGLSRHEKARDAFVTAGIFGILAGTLSQEDEM